MSISKVKSLRKEILRNEDKFENQGQIKTFQTPLVKNEVFAEQLLQTLYLFRQKDKTLLRIMVK